MPSHERRSPRAAIRDWLSQTVITSEATRPGRLADQAPWRGASHRQEICRSTEEKLPPKGYSHTAGKGSNPSVHQDVKVPFLSSRSGPRPDKTATSLGLDAPFRSFDHKANDADPLVDTEDRMRKRRRCISSSSSYLETARAVDHHQAQRVDHERLSKSKVDRNIRDDGDSASQSDSVVSIPEKHPKNYERKLRHKTREDRYKLKQDGSGKEKMARKSNPSKKKKRKQIVKSGTALMLDFSAQNVAQDRITLHSGPKLGLFTKGRASSPFRRGGLPDLAFSEMSFLNSRKEKLENSAKDVEKKAQRKRNKNADTEAEISRYFISKKSSGHREEIFENDPAVESSHQRTHHEHFRSGRKFSRNHNLPLSLAGLPEKPFLGFRRSGTPTTSPERRNRMNSTPNRTTRSQDKIMSPIQSTTYYTWSKTRDGSENSFQLPISPDVRSRLPNHLERNMKQGGEPLGGRNAKDNNDDEHNHANRSLSEGRVPNFRISGAARNNDEKKLPDQVANLISFQHGLDDLNQDDAASHAFMSSGKCKAQTLSKGTITKNSFVDVGSTADKILPSIPGPYGLTTQMPLASFDAVLGNLIANSAHSTLQPLHNIAYETDSMSKAQISKQVNGSNKSLSASELAKKRISKNENPNLNFVTRQPLQESIPRLSNPLTDRVTYSPNLHLSTLSSDRERSVRVDSCGKQNLRELGGQRANDEPAKPATRTGIGHDNLFAQQLGLRDSYLSDEHAVHKHNPFRTENFDDPIDHRTEAIGEEHDYGNYLNLENAHLSKQEHNQTFGLDEALSHQKEAYDITSEPDRAFYHNQNGLFQGEKFLDRYESQEEAFMYPSTNSHEQLDFYSVHDYPIAQGEASATYYPRILSPRYQAGDEYAEQNGEMFIPGFWKPNKLY